MIYAFFVLLRLPQYSCSVGFLAILGLQDFIFIFVGDLLN